MKSLTKKDIFFYSSDYFTKKMFDKQPYDKEKIKNTIEAMSFVKIDENNDRYRISTFTNNGDFVVLIFNITNVNCQKKTSEMRNYKEMNITQNLKNFSEEKLKSLIGDLLDTEYKIKSGFGEEEILINILILKV